MPAVSIEYAERWNAPRRAVCSLTTLSHSSERRSNVSADRLNNGNLAGTRLTHVPATVRQRYTGAGEPVLPAMSASLSRKTSWGLRARHRPPSCAPDIPLLDATIDLTLERHRDLLKRGAVLVDDADMGTNPRVLFFLEHAIQDASLTRSGQRRVISKRMLYVEIDANGVTRHLHYAPYLDYRPLTEEEPTADAILDRPECAWLDKDMERTALGHAVEKVVPEHLKEVRDAKLGLIAKTEAAVKDRLTKEIFHWDRRAEQLKLQEQAGKAGARLNSGERASGPIRCKRGCRNGWRS